MMKEPRKVKVKKKPVSLVKTPKPIAVSATEDENGFNHNYVRVLVEQRMALSVMPPQGFIHGDYSL